MYGLVVDGEVISMDTAADRASMVLWLNTTSRVSAESWVTTVPGFGLWPKKHQLIAFVLMRYWEAHQSRARRQLQPSFQPRALPAKALS